jgi:DNA-binding PadR family transcriptional regulator
MAYGYSPKKIGKRVQYTVARYIVRRYNAAMDPTAESLLPLPSSTFHILVALADRERHGYSIMQDVAARTNGAVKLSPGTLYGAIRRLLEGGLIEELDERPDPEFDDERRRYYRLTRFGRDVASAEAARLAKLVSQARATGLIPKRT